MSTETFKREDLEEYYQTLFNDKKVVHAVAVSFQAAVRHGHKNSPKAPLKKILRENLPRPLKEHLESIRDFTLPDENNIYDSIVDTLDDLRKHTRSKAHKKRSNTKKVMEEWDVNRKDASIQVILLDIANSYEKGLNMLGLNALAVAKDPESAFKYLNQQLGTVNIHLSKQRGTYAFISTDKDGNHERYAGVARNQNPYVNNASGYVSHEPSIGGRNTLELYKMVHTERGQFFEKRFGQFGRVKKISVLPMIQLSDETFKDLVDISSYDEYMTMMESLTMGLVAGFGIQPDGAGLNVRQADDKDAFLAGLSIAYPKTYRDLRLLENDVILKSWSDKDILNLFGLSKLYKTKEMLGAVRNPMDPSTFNKTKAELSLEKIRHNNGYQILDDNDPKVNDVFEMGSEWNNLLDRTDKIQRLFSKKTNKSINKYRNNHEIGAISFHDLNGISNRADRIKEVVSIFSDYPAIDPTWALSNLNTTVKYKKVDFSEKPVQDVENGESFGDFSERVKLYEESVDPSEAEEFEENYDQCDPSR